MKDYRFHIITLGKVVATALSGAGAMKRIYELQYTRWVPPSRRLPLDQPIFIRERCICPGEDHIPIFYTAAGIRILDAADVPQEDRDAEFKAWPE